MLPIEFPHLPASPERMVEGRAFEGKSRPIKAHAAIKAVQLARQGFAKLAGDLRTFGKDDVSQAGKVFGNGTNFCVGAPPGYP